MAQTTTPITFRADAKLLALIDVRSKKTGRTRAEVARDAVTAWLESWLDGGRGKQKPRARGADALASTYPAQPSSNALDVAQYSRPAHAEDCKCGVCQLRNGGKG